MPETDPETAGAAPSELRDALAAGTSLRSYEIVSVLGQGSFGITYRARDVTLNRDVAIKEYLPTSLALREGGTTVVPRSTELAGEFVWGRDRFLEEARTLAKFGRAPAVVRVHDFLEANGTAYMVMELVQGETLDHRIKRDGSLPSKAIERLLYPLLDGLEQVHGIGFLHRDIKPSNIILDAMGNPTLIDFGASRAAMAGRTTAMTAIFTPGYAAAEQFTSTRQGPWTDIYGLSATIYDAITGKPPPSAFDRLLDDAYEPLAKLRPTGFSLDLLKGIDAGLAVRGDDRPQTIDGWRKLLSPSAAPSDDTTLVLASRPFETATPDQAPNRTQRHSTVETPVLPVAGSAGTAGKKRTALYVGLAAAVLAVGGAGYFLLAPKLGPTSVVRQDLKVEDLEKVLAERRGVDAVASEKKRLEEDARRRVETDAVSKQAADAELAQAQLQRQKAEEELARLKAEMEVRRQQDAGLKEQADAIALRAAKEASQRKAEAEMATLRQAEEDAQRKAVAEAEAKRQADAALATAQVERQKADQEAAVHRQAEEEAARKTAVEAEATRKAADEAKQKADADAKQKTNMEATAAAKKKAAEAAENALRLTLTDRQRIQVALTSLGFSTAGVDGIFGARSREMIGAWQKAHREVVSGYLTGPQQQALLREAASSVARYDDEQKTLEEAKRKVDDEARAGPAQDQGQAMPPTVTATTTMPGARVNAQPFDGKWRGTGKCGSDSNFTIILSVQNSTIVGKAEPFGTESSQAFSFRGEVDSASGAVLLDVRDEGHFDGKINGRRMSVKGWTGLANCQFTLDQVSPS